MYIWSDSYTIPEARGPGASPGLQVGERLLLLVLRAGVGSLQRWGLVKGGLAIYAFPLCNW